MCDADQFREILPPGYRGRKSGPGEVYRAQLPEARTQGNATEHTHRQAVQAMLEALVPAIAAVNQPRRAAERATPAAHACLFLWPVKQAGGSA